MTLSFGTTLLNAGLLVLIGFAPSPVRAETTTYNLPSNCTAFLTIQQKSCVVSHYFTCTGDAEGYQRRVDLDEQGMTYIGQIDAETQWIESFHALSGHSERLMPDPVDPASFSELITNGSDRYDFRTESPELGLFRYQGEDRLTGKTITIDGVTLDETSYKIRAMDAEGTEMWRSAGTEYISRDWRLFIAGISTIVTPTDTFDTDDSPMEFLFPDETGFLSANPKYGCGAVISFAPEANLSQGDNS